MRGSKGGTSVPPISLSWLSFNTFYFCADTKKIRHFNANTKRLPLLQSYSKAFVSLISRFEVCDFGLVDKSYATNEKKEAYTARPAQCMLYLSLFSSCMPRLFLFSISRLAILCLVYCKTLTSSSFTRLRAQSRRAKTKGPDWRHSQPQVRPLENDTVAR